jgi:transposase
VQKAFNELNLHLHHMLSDISGYSGLAIPDSILAGERDPRKLASLVDHRIKKSRAQNQSGADWRLPPGTALRAARLSLEKYRQIQQQITQRDPSIERQLAQMAGCTKPKPNKAERCLGIS